MQWTQQVNQLLVELMEVGRLVADLGYAKRDLVELFAQQTEPARAAPLFRALRSWATGNRPLKNGYFIVTSGVRRSTRYHLTKSPHTVPRNPSNLPAATQQREPQPMARGAVTLIHADNMEILPKLAAASFRMIYIDPPFNTGRTQSRRRIRTERVSGGGDRTGYKGARYKTTVLGEQSYEDTFGDEYLAFLEPRLHEAYRLLSPDGSLFLHLDYREVHYAKIMLDGIFGRNSFINELIWAYDYGARTKKKWSAKHDNILWYAKTPNSYVFNYNEMDRIPYMAPGLVGPKKAARGKTPTDVWWHTIVSPNGSEKTGYPTQKPLGILRRLVRVHSNPGDRLLDFFAGSGTLGEAGASLGRDVTLIDANPEALKVMRKRLARFTPAPEPETQAPEQVASSRPQPANTATQPQVAPMGEPAIPPPVPVANTLPPPQTIVSNGTGNMPQTPMTAKAPGLKTSEQPVDGPEGPSKLASPEPPRPPATTGLPIEPPGTLHQNRRRLGNESDSRNPLFRAPKHHRSENAPEPFALPQVSAIEVSERPEPPVGNDPLPVAATSLPTSSIGEQATTSPATCVRQPSCSIEDVEATSSSMYQQLNSGSVAANPQPDNPPDCATSPTNES